MKNNNIILLCLLVLIIQLILTKYGQIGPYIYIMVLPALILRMPASWPSYAVVLAAFAAGFIVDGLSDGPLGLNAVALGPVAAIRTSIWKMFFREESITRKYDFSVKNNGLLPVLGAVTLMTALFFLLYIIFDINGQNSIWFYIGKFFASCVASIISGMIVCIVISPEKND